LNVTNLAMLIELANVSCDAALAQLARVQRDVQQARAQLDTLVRFRADYAQRAQAQLRSGCDAAANANLARFAQRLEQAALAQAQEMRHREHLLAQATEEHLQAQRKRKSLEALAARQAETVRLTEQRRDQKHTDETAQTVHARGSANPGS
jgi:flagellar FliJ protein